MKATEGNIAGSWTAIQAEVEELSLKWYKAQLEFSTFLNQRPFDSGEWDLRGDSLLLYGTAGTSRYRVSMPDEDTLVLENGQSVQRFLRKEDWQEVLLYGAYTATSTLQGEDWFGGGDTPYSARHLGDGNPATCWAEGSEGSGIGEKIYLPVDGLPKGLIIANGYGKSPALFAKNNRVRTMKATVLAAFNLRGDISEVATKYYFKKCGPAQRIEVKDIQIMQAIPLTFDGAQVNRAARTLASSFEKDFSDELERRAQGEEARYSRTLIICLEIFAVYQGTKFDDTCISRLTLE
jgi:hypothetical protein